MVLPMCRYGATIPSASGFHSAFHPVDDIGDVTDVYEGDSYNNEKRCDFNGEIAKSCNISGTLREAELF